MPSSGEEDDCWYSSNSRWASGTNPSTGVDYCAPRRAAVLRNVATTNDPVCWSVPTRFSPAPMDCHEEPKAQRFNYAGSGVKKNTARCGEVLEEESCGDILWPSSSASSLVNTTEFESFEPKGAEPMD
jgi:hypothetical protein